MYKKLWNWRIFNLDKCSTSLASGFVFRSRNDYLPTSLVLTFYKFEFSIKIPDFLIKPYKDEHNHLNITRYGIHFDFDEALIMLYYGRKTKGISLPFNYFKIVEKIPLNYVKYNCILENGKKTIFYVSLKKYVCTRSKYSFFNLILPKKTYLKIEMGETQNIPDMFYNLDDVNNFYIKSANLLFKEHDVVQLLPVYGAD